MRHTLPIAPQFYVTAPQPCPYLDGRMERKLFTALQGESAEALNDALSKQGFRRSQNVLYRPSCADCAACLSARIRVADFVPNRSQRRAQRRNATLQRRSGVPWATEDQYTLFRRYLDSRHADGGMADMDIFEFAAMLEETPVRSRVVEYLAPAGPPPPPPEEPAALMLATAAAGRADLSPNANSDRGGDPGVDQGRSRRMMRARAGRGDTTLAAVCLTDVLDDGLSLVYSFFDPDRAGDSLGTHIILDHVAMAREAGLPYVYLGYWVPGSRKMGYKSRFAALEVYYRGQWQDLGDPESYSSARHPLSVDPIATQVARIVLPDSRAGKG